MKYAKTTAGILGWLRNQGPKDGSDSPVYLLRIPSDTSIYTKFQVLPGGAIIYLRDDEFEGLSENELLVVKALFL